MNDDARDATTVAAVGAAGAAGGAALTVTIGGIGVAATGTAFALPVVAIGTGIGLIVGGRSCWGDAWNVGAAEAPLHRHHSRSPSACARSNCRRRTAEHDPSCE